MVTLASSGTAWGSVESSNPLYGQQFPPKRKYSDAEVDAYAQRVLESRATQSPDSSLGSYVTSLLRSSDLATQDLKDIAEFDSLVELIREHCDFTELDSLEALQTIATAVKKKEIPFDDSTSTKARGSIYNNNLDSFQSQNHDFPSLSESQNANLSTPREHSQRTKDAQKKKAGSPMQAGDLIPVDLMGALDDPSTPKHGQGQGRIPAFNPAPQTTVPAPAPMDEAAFPSLSSASKATTTKRNKPTGSKRTGSHASSTKSQQAGDLAAALFVSPRSRQSSIDETHSSPNMQPATAPSSAPAMYLDEHLYASTIEMLLSMNADLGEEAAAMATSMTGDINLAQYLVDSVLSAPPMCRDVLSGAGCYRADCSFSHEIEVYTCAFWLRGRCGKGASCRFFHGFNPQLLEGVYSQPETLQQEAFPELPAPSSTYTSTGASGWSSERKGGHASSFASIASKKGGSFQDQSLSSPVSRQSFAKPKKVDIPLEVWSAHENRDASAFYIADPIERYTEVSRTARRSDVMDLHFQSIKTFPVVLSHILPTKLMEHPNGVWVVTGTGHHVGSRTHQKGGGALESAVMKWLQDEGYSFAKGRDRNGLSGALLVFS